jgi:peptidoglycan hydrolase CwlO-like protein
LREQNRHTENKLEDAKENYEKNCSKLAATLKEYESSKNRLIEQDE